MKEEKRDAVIETARGLFARYGFGKTTVDEIARYACVAKSTIYTYFGSKEEIFEKVIDNEGEILFGEIKTAIRDIHDPVEKMRTYAVTRMSHIKKLHNLYTALNDEYLKHYSFIEKARKKSLEKEMRFIKEILREGVESGAFEIQDLNLSAFTIITAWKGLDFPWTEDVDIPDSDESVHYLIEVLFNGIRKR